LKCGDQACRRNRKKENSMNIASFAFVDPTMFLSTMTLKYGRHFNDNDHPVFLSEPPFEHCRHIPLRGPVSGDWRIDDAQSDYPLLMEWPSARALIENVGNAIATYLAAGQLQIGQIVVRSLPSSAFIGWNTDTSEYAKRHHRFALLVSPCAGGSWYSGGESLTPGVGNLTYFNHQMMNSQINLGAAPQISLVVDVRKPTLQ
jgi:hypothetical protein